MVVPFVLLILSLGAAVASVFLWGPVASAPLLLALICAVGALFLLVLAPRRSRPRWIVVDGSNVMHWNDETPALETVGRVVEALQGRGYAPVVWFDANVGYRVGQRYMGPRPLANALGLPERQVFVAPKGTPADPLLLRGSDRLKARVVTNDRFRDWVEDHPQVQEPGFLVRGHVRGGAVRLELAE
ncbi:MAG: hypothetical protein JXJ18_14400 [Rhodobacteraceae bacterium]|nr:hypothetical protein [Paracoccaceae bacterium]